MRTKAIPLSLGKAANNLLKALSPPADAQIPAIGGPRWDELVVAVAHLDRRWLPRLESALDRPRALSLPCTGFRAGGLLFSRFAGFFFATIGRHLNCNPISVSEESSQGCHRDRERIARAAAVSLDETLV